MNPMRRLSVVCLLVSAAACGAQETPAQIPSPDGKFVFEFIEPNEDATFGQWRIVAKENGEPVWESPDGANVTWVRDAKCVWSPDSKMFALNYRAGARYEVVEVYRREGNDFVALPSFEPLLAARLDESKGRQLRELVDKLPPSFAHRDDVLNGSFQRRLWDQYRALRWIDDDTLEVIAYSIRHITTPDGAMDDEEISAALRFVIRNERDQWRILKERAVPIRETDQGQP